ncbi:hypothetical protein SRIMM317S_00457 [Streptomyces rimosus subsp. rimosus]
MGSPLVSARVGPRRRSLSGSPFDAYDGATGVQAGLYLGAQVVVAVGGNEAGQSTAAKAFGEDGHGAPPETQTGPGPRAAGASDGGRFRT